MVSKHNQISSGLTPKQIIDLGESLASFDTYQAQEQYLQNFLQKHFGGSATIWLSTPPKSILPEAPDFPFPNDPQHLSSSINKDQSLDNIQTLNQPPEGWVILPLMHGKAEIGKLLLNRQKPYTDQELDSLKDISKIAGLSIYATLQGQMQNWRQKQLALVRSVSAQISQIMDLDLLTQQITTLVQESFDYYYVAIFLIHQDTQRLHFKASAGSDQSDRPEFEREEHPGFAIGEHMIGHAAETGLELVAEDVTKEPRYKAVDSLKETKSEVVIPLKVESRIFGVFDIQSDQRNAFDQNDLLVLRALADNIALAIESARLYQGVQSRADQLASVSEVSRAITYILDIDELLQRIVNLIHERFDYPFVHLYTVDPVRKTINFKAGSGERTANYHDLSVSFDVDAKIGVLSWVVQHGQTQRINDIQSEPLFIRSPHVEVATGSEMAIPLFFGGQILGVLDVQSEKNNAFSIEDQQLLETLADNIAIAIRNARLYRSEKWRRQVAESLRDVAGLLSENVALENVLNEILEQLHKNLPCDIAAIWLFNPDISEEIPPESREMVLTAHLSTDGYPPEMLDQIAFTPDEWVKNALIKKQPTIRQIDDTIGPIATQYNLPQEYSSIAAPLHTGEEVLGLLTMVHHNPGRYGAESQKITSAFASYAAVAIKNTRLYATSQEQAWISTILLQVAQATQSLTNLDELVSTIVRLTPMVVGVKGCALFLIEPDSEIFSLYAMYGIGELSGEMSLEDPLPLPNAPIFDELLITQEPLRVRHPDQDFNLPDSFSFQMEKETLILLPVMARNEILGAFMLANESKEKPGGDGSKVISEERFKIVQGIIQQTAIAIENIRLLEAKQEEAYVSTVLLQVAQAIVSSAELEDTLDSIVHIMPILVGIESSVIYLWDENEKMFRTSHATIKNSSNEDELLDTKFSPGDFPTLDLIFRSNRPVAVPFVETVLPAEDWDLVLPDEGQIDPTPVLQSRFPLLMGFPLSMKNEVFGVLLAQDENYATNRERRFELLWGIAQQASLAIQNDLLNKEMLDRQRLEREFQLAREIQQTFLPNQVPEITGWEMDVHWETARQVGGDFYDYFLLPDGRLAFVIADVSDKGLAASLYMTVTRTLLRAAALESTSPSETLEHVNDLLLVNSQNGLFVTAFYGILSLDDGTLTYAIAGHNPPMVIRYQANHVVELPMGGIALGALPDIKLQEEKIILGQGDCIVLYTDGVTEAFNFKDQMYGNDRLKKVLESRIGHNASSVLSTLEADLDNFRDNAPLSDDTTILAIFRSHSLADEDGDTSTAQDTVHSTSK